MVALVERMRPGWRGVLGGGGKPWGGRITGVEVFGMAGGWQEVAEGDIEELGGGRREIVEGYIERS
jgi:hypothetical protein